VWDTDRERATRRMLRALGEYEIEGIATLIPFHTAILDTEQWARGETGRDLISDREWLKSLAPEPLPDAEPPEGDGEPAATERTYRVEVDGRLYGVRVIGDSAAPVPDNPSSGLRRPPRRERARAGGGDGATDTLVSPIQGTVLRVPVEKGDQIEAGALICVVEAMKMENEITAHRSGKLTTLNVEEGGSVASGETIAVIE
jgi:acetyl-CoA/propionyl-CoA carboxylase, biotin carboxylase, biotin carboxyl carrier protein